MRSLCKIPVHNPSEIVGSFHAEVLSAAVNSINFAFCFLEPDKTELAAEFQRTTYRYFPRRLARCATIFPRSSKFFDVFGTYPKQSF